MLIEPEYLDYRGADEMHATMMRALEPKSNLMVSEWADEYRILSDKHAVQHGPWSTDLVPFLREPMDALSAQSHVSAVSLIKGAQLGGTEAANNWVGYSVGSDPAPMMYVLPTGTVLKRTSNRIQEMVDSDPNGLGKLILPARKRDSQNSQYEKHFPGGAIYFATARSATNLRSTMARRIIFDEIDAYVQDVQGEGSVLGVAEQRGNTAGSSFKQFEISTPLLEKTSIIKKRFLKGDQRNYFMPCPHCGNYIYFKRERFEYNPENIERTIHYKCECNQKIYEGIHKRDMMARGVWIPKALQTDGHLEQFKNGDFSELEKFNKSSFHWSYHLPSFYAAIGLTWTKIFKNWESAKGDPIEEQTIINTMFGETYTLPGDAKDPDEIYARRTSAYQLRDVHPGVLFLTAGADVGVDHIEFHVWGWGPRRQRYLIDVIRINGITAEPEPWDILSDLVKRCYWHPSGAILPIKRVLIDRNKWPDLVDNWINTQDKRQVIGVRGASVFDADLIKWVSKKVKGPNNTFWRDESQQSVYAGVGRLKLEIYNSFSMTLREDQDYPSGWIHFPIDTPKLWAQQMVSEELKFGDANRNKPKWVRSPGVRSEALDCAVYARVGAELEGWNTWTDREVDREKTRIKTAAAELKHAIASYETARARDGEDVKVEVKDIAPSLVRPEIEGAISFMTHKIVEERKVSSDPDIDIDVESVDEKVIETKQEIQMSPIKANTGLVGFKKIDHSLLMPVTRENDDDDF